MNWIDSKDIRDWAGRRDCQQTLPQLVRKLIRATSTSIGTIKFPSGENVLIGGWDGILDVSEETEYLPLGTTLWEFGANADPKGKADEDYDKRSQNPLGYNPLECTFIFVTPRLWTKGDKWAKEKQKEKKWKDVKVINAEILEEWLETAPTVSSWLAIRIGKYPEGVQSTEDFWDEWSSGPLKLNPSILLGGRDESITELFKLTASPSLVGVQGTSREEALAFIVASYKNNPEREEDFFARSLIIDNPETFRRVAALKNALILIPRFNDASVMNKAVSAGHTVIVPLDPDASNNWNNKIVLPNLSRDLFVKSLEDMGIAKELAENYSKESTRNISVLRRKLKFSGNLPEWAKQENVREIIPALIVGRWDESFEGDKNIIAKIAGENYELYSQKLIRWLHAPDSPLYKIGSTWRLASPFDAWNNVGVNLTSNDFELLKATFLELLSEIDPAFDLESENRKMASFYGKNRYYSNWIREGTTQSLILISIFGNQLDFGLSTKGELWVDRIIADFLNNDNPVLWKSIDSQLPLIAEASPTSFLSALEKYIPTNNSPIIALFESDPGLFTPRSYHTGLLWALEGVIWAPEYLSRASLILAKLASVDPDTNGNLSNRPINSLSEIFTPWHFQTFSTFKERMEVLDLISKKEIEIAWILFLRMLPGGREIGSFTHKMRWRLSDKILEPSVQWQEIWDTHTHALDLLLLIFDFSEKKFGELIEKSTHLSHYDREKLFVFIEQNIEKISQTEYFAWHATRLVITSHRSYPDADWALSEKELNKYEKLEKLLQPTDDLNKYIWLFNEHWPTFPESKPLKGRSHDDMQKTVDDKRIEGIQNIYKRFGIEKIKELAGTVKETWTLGYTTALILDNVTEIDTLCEFLKGEPEDPSSRFIFGFIYRKSLLKGIKWIFELYEKLKSEGLDNHSLAHLFIYSLPSQELWNFIEKVSDEVKNEYWSKVNVHFYGLGIEEKIIVIKKLILFKRFFSGVKICVQNIDEMPSSLMVDLLEKTAMEPTIEKGHLESYDVTRMFKTFNERNDIEQQVLINLEWLFLPILSSPSYGNSNPQVLHGELSKKPDFFIEVMRWAYKPDNDELLVSEKKELTAEQFQNRASRAYELLNSWKSIPGVEKDGGIDAAYLHNWVNTVRELASVHSRIHIADSIIGKILAQYPEKNENWPPNEICSIIEEINSDSIKRNFSTALFNKRSLSTRGPFDGGNIERGHAIYFAGLSGKIMNKFPIVAGIFSALSKGYEQDAKRMDESAERDKLDY